MQAGGGSASGGSLAGGVVVLLCPQDLSIDSLAPTGKKLSSVKGALEFKNIHFRYPARSDSQQSWSNLGPSACLPASRSDHQGMVWWLAGRSSGCWAAPTIPRASASRSRQGRPWPSSDSPDPVSEGPTPQAGPTPDWQDGQLDDGCRRGLLSRVSCGVRGQARARSSPSRSGSTTLRRARSVNQPASQAVDSQACSAEQGGWSCCRASVAGAAGQPGPQGHQRAQPARQHRLRRAGEQGSRHGCAQQAAAPPPLLPSQSTGQQPIPRVVAD